MLDKAGPVLFLNEIKTGNSMKTGRPKIKVPYQNVDIILELLSATILIFIVAYSIVSYSELPDTIATHFNAKGEADGFGNKSTIWLLTGISVFIYLLLFFINKVPHLHNYMVNITEENALKNYRLSNRMVRCTNLFCLLLFAGILYDSINIARGGTSSILGIPFLIATILLPIIGIAYMFYLQNKINT